MLSACALVLTACGPGEDELRRERLDEVAAATFAGPVAFNLQVEATDAGLAGLGDDAAPLAGLLAGTSASGVVEGDRVAIGLTVASLDLLQLRVTAPGEQYLRFDLAGVAELAAGGAAGLERELDRVLRGSGLDREVRTAVLATARGEWVRLEAAASGGASAGSSVGGALQALLLAAEPIDSLGALDRPGPFSGQLTIELDPARALAAAAEVLAGLAPDLTAGDRAPDGVVVRGRVTIDDGVARTVTLELGGLLADGAAGVVGSDLELVLDLRPLAVDEPLVRAPEAVASVTVEQLRAALAVFPALGASPRP